MTKESNTQQSLGFTIPTISIQPDMIISNEILNPQGNIIIPKNYKVKDNATADRMKRILEQHNIETISVRIEKEVTADQLSDLMNIQADTLGEKATENTSTKIRSKKNQPLGEIIDSLDIEDMDFFKKTLPQWEQGFNEVFASLTEDTHQETNTLEQSILESMKIIEKSVSVFQVMDKLKNVGDSLYIHCYQMGITSYMIGKWLHLDDQQNQELFVCGMMADVGLSKVPAEVRYEPYSTSEEDQAAYRQHAKHSYLMLKNVSFLSDLSKKAILHHHEQMDGKGFPSQYRKNRISLFSKILYIAHLYGYYTQNNQENPLRAINLIHLNHLKEVDLNVFYIFENRIYDYFIGQKVRVNTEEIFTGDIVLFDRIDSSTLIKTEDNRFIHITLKTFHNNLVEFI
ncbi:HD-GYP domain-containing protein [Alkaliphilus metalliredigens]|uniref:HD-GYP domain-containing protein n=1 Tax=Alkaliphilus metalliredigens TaxID=208226 RepID=UPI00005CBE5C|nr:HD domain-containing phosphohydrolase [Alkaliphilus metalliredigens]